MGIEKSDNELLQEISGKLSELTAVVGITGKGKDEQVAYLVSLGFTNAEISRITAIPKGTVDWIRASAKKAKESKNDKR